MEYSLQSYGRLPKSATHYKTNQVEREKVKAGQRRVPVTPFSPQNPMRQN